MVQRLPALGSFKGRRVLLLQGPVGPFFDRLAKDLQNIGAVVFKINFNGGDRLFCSVDRSVDYTGTLDAWPAFLERFVETNGIDTIFLYGDCRPVHDAVFNLSLKDAVAVFTFEEGYIRPHYVTLERGRVNGSSSLPRDPEWFRNLPEPPDEPDLKTPKTYWHMAFWGLLYHVAAFLQKKHFPHARALYHRGLGAEEFWPQVCNVWRKLFHAVRDWPLSERLMRFDRGNFFFVPLQVASDSQVYCYSRYGDRQRREGRIEEFILDVMRSFAQHAPASTKLVFKHHPMDRGYRHYGAFIRRHARNLDIADRVIYLVKNVPTPTLINSSLGVIVINSTVGLQGVLHMRPVKVLGEAIYDMPGLTAQCDLDMFWCDAETYVPDKTLVRRYAHFLRDACLIHGSFFRRLKESPLHCGLIWSIEADEMAQNMSKAYSRESLSSPTPKMG